MDIIAIKDVSPEPLRGFLKHWWPLWGILKQVREWTFIFVRGTGYFGTIDDYARLISSVMDKLVIYIRGNSGVITQLNIYDGGQLCPTSNDHAERMGRTGTHDCWFVKNRLVLWSVSNEAQGQIRELLGEDDVDPSNTIIRLPVSDSLIHQQLADSLFDSWGLPRVWSHDSLDDVANDQDSTAL